MTAFTAALSALFSDPNMSLSALYRVGGEGDGAAVRVIRSAPDEVMNFGSTRILVDTVILQVRISEAPELAEGDTIEIAGEVFEVRAEPKRDADRLVWTAEARAL